MPSDSRDSTMHTLLRLDAATCALMAVVLLAAGGAIASLTQLPSPLLLGAGVLLLPVAAFIWALSRMVSIPALGAKLVIGGNVLWVLASLLLPILGIITPNAWGWAFLVAQAAVVVAFIALEWRAMPARAALTH